MEQQQNTETENLTEEDKQLLAQIAGTSGSVGMADGRHNAHTFLHGVVLAEDTTKLGVLTDQELGGLDNPVRAYKFLETFAEDIMDNEELAKHFRKQSEIITSSSLSRNGTLVKLAVTQKRELADVTAKQPTEKQKKSWFGSKDKKQEEVVV